MHPQRFTSKTQCTNTRVLYVHICALVSCSDKVRKGLRDWKTGAINPPMLEHCSNAQKQHPDAIVFPKVILMVEKQCRDVAGDLIAAVRSRNGYL